MPSPRYHYFGGPEYSSLSPLTWHDRVAMPLLMMKPLARGTNAVEKL